MANVNLSDVKFDDIKPWTWYIIEAGDYDLSGFTMLLANKISEDEWVAFDYSRKEDDWVEKPPTTMTREEWDRYERGLNISKTILAGSPEWSSIAQDAMKTIFLSSVEFFDHKD